MTGPLESASVKQIVKALEAKKCVVINNHGTAASGKGRPDLTGCAPGGYAFALEVKRRDGGTVERIQEYNIRQWLGVGARAGVVRTVGEAFDVVFDVFPD